MPPTLVPFEHASYDVITAPADRLQMRSEISAKHTILEYSILPLLWPAQCNFSDSSRALLVDVLRHLLSCKDVTDASSFDLHEGSE